MRASMSSRADTWYGPPRSPWACWRCWLLRSRCRPRGPVRCAPRQARSRGRAGGRRGGGSRRRRRGRRGVGVAAAAIVTVVAAPPATRGPDCWQLQAPPTAHVSAVSSLAGQECSNSYSWPRLLTREQGLPVVASGPQHRQRVVRADRFKVLDDTFDTAGEAGPKLDQRVAALRSPRAHRAVLGAGERCRGRLDRGVLPAEGARREPMSRPRRERRTIAVMCRCAR